MKLNTFLLFVCLVFVSSLALLFTNPIGYLSNLYQQAGIFFVTSITEDDVRLAYSNAKTSIEPKKLNVLIMPGHEPDGGGTEFGNYKERDIVIDIASELSKLLSNHSEYNIIIPRSKDSWNPIFENYFKDNWQAIIDWQDSHKDEMVRLINDGRVKTAIHVYHNNAPRDMAIRLYGINKWVNENDVKIALHLHINDYPRRNTRNPGIHSGISIYVPEGQYSNAGASKTVGNYIFKRLTSFMSSSTLPLESEGVVEDQELIAIGSYNTVDAVSLLIEYGYIYESLYSNPDIRPLAVKEVAFLTYLGLKDFFGDTSAIVYPFNSVLFPYEWKKDIRMAGTSGSGGARGDSVDVFLLQRAMQLKGHYPPMGKSLADCPVTGYFGNCTKTALINFQKTFSVEETGILDQNTRAVLNDLFK